MSSYYGGYDRRLAFPPITWAVKRLLILNFALWGVIYLLFLVNRAAPTGVYRNVGLNLERFVTEPWFAFWQPFTYMFLHDIDPGHVLWNMVSLYFFGVFLEELRGTREFLRTYVVGGILGGLVWIVFQGLVLGRPASLLVGASGACLAVLVATTTRFPRKEVWLFGMLPIQLWLLAVVLVSLDLVQTLNTLRYGGGTGVAHTAHLGGALLGFLSVRFERPFARFCETFEDLPRTFRKVRAKQKFESEVERRKKVEALLDKINREGGIGALSRSERAFLKRASKHYNQRG